MFSDSTDKLIAAFLLATAAGLVGVLLFDTGDRAGSRASRTDKAMERQIASRARAALLQQLYAPVDELRAAGQFQAALLKLDEVGRSYPGEAHGSILQGEILLHMGAVNEAAASFVRGVKLNGEYVDRKSPLSRRQQIEKLVQEGLKPASGSVTSASSRAALQKDLFYLQSRLAGGCE
ncbi:hypothetical protein [Geobacter sp. DSM 9736]|uniref:hypothetical protein n=1 Tax=Geobacter sp. DSM 9736 TaxID=1277350 RepID=UPI000B4FD66B|nr:hypothetical protein [Geobacter sp. DSM 9736]SNB47407.1 hypothetical protein SAMN06269301_2896 [Geobacter sp. DSM 9736]